MSFQPTVLISQREVELRWIGRLLIPGLFDGEHYFIIEKMGLNKVKFIHGEKFRGILAFLMWGMVEPGTKEGFNEMNKALKVRCESNNL